MRNHIPISKIIILILILLLIVTVALNYSYTIKIDSDSIDYVIYYSPDYGPQKISTAEYKSELEEIIRSIDGTYSLKALYHRSSQLQGGGPAQVSFYDKAGNICANLWEMDGELYIRKFFRNFYFVYKKQTESNGLSMLKQFVIHSCLNN